MYFPSVLRRSPESRYPARRFTRWMRVTCRAWSAPALVRWRYEGRSLCPVAARAWSLATLSRNWFEQVEDMEAIPRSRRPRPFTHSTRSWRSKLGSAGPSVSPATTSSEPNAAPSSDGATPRTINGKSGHNMVGACYSTSKDASLHQSAMNCVDDGKYQAMVVSPLSSGRLDPPDVVFFYAILGARM